MLRISNSDHGHSKTNQITRNLFMKLIKIIGFVLTVFLLFGSFASAQNKSEARLIDEYGLTNQGDVLARLDSFLIRLQNQPDAAGFVIGYGTRKP